MSNEECGSEKVRCNCCGQEYTDKGSVETVKKWIAEGYAPCPNLSCPGEFEIAEAGEIGSS